MPDSVPPGYESRRFSRVSIRLPIAVTPSDGKVFVGETRDISALGVFVVHARELPQGSRCKIHIGLEQEKAIEATGIVARLEKAGFGVEFTSVKESSFDALRELIIAHGHDSHALDTEIISRAELLPKTH